MCETWYTFSQMWRICTKFSQMWRNRTKSSHMWRIGTKSSHLLKNSIKTHTCEDQVPNSHTCEDLVPNSHTCRKLVPNHHKWEELVLNRHRCQWQNCEELESNAKCSRFGGISSMWVIRMHAKWNLILCVFFLKCEILVRNMAYWYQFFTCYEDLVLIIHSGIFTRCEICGSTKLIYLVCSNV